MVYFPVLHHKIFYKRYFQTKNFIYRYHYCQAKTQETDVLKGCRRCVFGWFGTSIFKINQLLPCNILLLNNSAAKWSASSSFSTHCPPACAISGLPPPPPPTTFAISFEIFPACKPRLTSPGVRAATIVTRPFCEVPKTMASSPPDFINISIVFLKSSAVASSNFLVMIFTFETTLALSMRGPILPLNSFCFALWISFCEFLSSFKISCVFVISLSSCVFRVLHTSWIIVSFSLLLFN